MYYFFVVNFGVCLSVCLFMLSLTKSYFYNINNIHAPLNLCFSPCHRSSNNLSEFSSHHYLLLWPLSLTLSLSFSLSIYLSLFLFISLVHDFFSLYSLSPYIFLYLSVVLILSRSASLPSLPLSPFLSPSLSRCISPKEFYA